MARTTTCKPGFLRRAEPPTGIFFLYIAAPSTLLLAWDPPLNMVEELLLEGREIFLPPSILSFRYVSFVFYEILVVAMSLIVCLSGIY